MLISAERLLCQKLCPHNSRIPIWGHVSVGGMGPCVSVGGMGPCVSVSGMGPCVSGWYGTMCVSGWYGAIEMYVLVV